MNSDFRAEDSKAEFPSQNIVGVVGNLAAGDAIGNGVCRQYCEEDLNRFLVLQD